MCGWNSCCAFGCFKQYPQARACVNFVCCVDFVCGLHSAGSRGIQTLDGGEIQVERAPDPTNIQWENLAYERRG